MTLPNVKHYIKSTFLNVVTVLLDTIKFSIRCFVSFYLGCPRTLRTTLDRTCFLTNTRQYTIVYTYTEARSINRCTFIWHSRHIGPFGQSFLLLLSEDWFTRITKTVLLYCLNKRKEKTFNLMILVRNKILCRQHHLAIIDRFPYEDLERL